MEVQRLEAIDQIFGRFMNYDKNIQNKEVILPSMSFVSTAHAVTANNAKPVFVDINPKNLCMSENDIFSKINNKTIAVFLDAFFILLI